MFTGLIEEVGTVVAFEANSVGPRLRISAPKIAGMVGIGDSIAVNGCCLTVTRHEETGLQFHLLEETLERTNLKMLAAGGLVNLERAVNAGAPLGGHFVQGHVDCVARIVGLEPVNADARLEIELPREHAHYVAEKGSIAVDGISLTVADVLPKSFVCWVIPHTANHTNLSTRKAGDFVNIEFDLLAKYVERMIDRNR